MANTEQEFVVDRTSAHLDPFDNFGIGRDHYQLNKYYDPEDGDFRVVSREFCYMVEDYFNRLEVTSRRKLLLGNSDEGSLQAYSPLMPDVVTR